ncbi:MAG TPA: hypothetical protein VN654_17440 [Vicinamibacterales bacterium]|nr:hypothetical protein [Vicinamibacterales bacterium]
MSPRMRFGLALLLLAACGSTPVEQQVLTQFFRAARVRDNTTLAGMSAVNFDPRTEGAVEDFKIDSIGEPQHRQLQIQQLTEEQEKIRADQVEFTKKMRDFYQSNSIAIDRAAKADQAKQPVRGQDAALLTEWKKWDADSRDLERKLSQARQRVARERSTAVNSLTAPGRQDVDTAGMDVDIITEPVTVTAQVQTPDGKTTPKTLVVTLQRASGKKDGQTIEGRWIIMSIQPPGGAAPQT